MGWIEASISQITCPKGHRAPHLTFHGDTDMVTNGLVSLSSYRFNEVVVAELKPEELADQLGTSVQTRVGELLAREDLKFVRLVRLEGEIDPAGLTFKEYQMAYQPPKLIFACPICGNDAGATPIESLDAFARMGGRITVLPDLELRG